MVSAFGMLKPSTCRMEHGGVAPLLRPTTGRGRRSHARFPVHAALRQLSNLQHILREHVVAARAPTVLHQPGDAQMTPSAAAHSALRAAVALLAAVCLQLGGGSGAAHAFNLASVAEDKLLEFVRKVEVRVDSALEAVKDVAVQVRQAAAQQGLCSDTAHSGCQGGGRLGRPPFQMWASDWLPLHAMLLTEHCWVRCKSCLHAQPVPVLTRCLHLALGRPACRAARLRRMPLRGGS